MGDVKKKPERFLELEGLRGIAAIVVASYHGLLGFFTVAFLGTLAVTHSTQNSYFETMLLGNPLAVFLSGTFAVSIFFVLSGFVLSIGFFQTGREDIVKSLAVRRYFRLMLPALASTLVCLIAIKIGVSRVHEAQALTGSAWMAAMWNPPYGILDAFKSALFGIFVDGHSAYNNVLWTMTTEFIGSFMVFITLLVAGKSSYRWIAYILLGVLSIGTWYMAFVAGMIIADLYSHSSNTKYTHPILLTVLLAGIAIYFGGYPAVGSYGTYYSWIPSTLQIACYVIGAIAAVLIALWSKSVRRFLAWRPISNLGKYTFSLYLIHIPVIYTFTYWLFLKLHLHYGYGYTVSAVVALVASVPILIGVTYFFEKLIDAPAIRFAARFSDIFLGKERLNFPKIPAAYHKFAVFIKRNLVGYSSAQYEALSPAKEQESEVI